LRLYSAVAKAVEHPYFRMTPCEMAGAFGFYLVVSLGDNAFGAEWREIKVAYNP